MSVLELLEALGNISGACNRKGIISTQFYEWTCCFQMHGMEVLKAVPPILKNHPFTTPKEVVEKIKNILPKVQVFSAFVGSRGHTGEFCNYSEAFG